MTLVSRTARDHTCNQPQTHAIRQVFWVSNLATTATSFFLTLFVLYLHILVIQGLSFTTAAVIPERFQTSAAMLIITFLFGFGGFFVPLPEMPVWYSWTRYLNFISYTYQTILSVTITAAAGAQGFACSAPTDAASQNVDVSLCVNGFVSAETVLQTYGVGIPVWACAIALIGWLFALRILSFILLWVKFVGRHRRAERALIGGEGNGTKVATESENEQVSTDIV